MTRLSSRLSAWLLPLMTLGLIAGIMTGRSCVSVPAAAAAFLLCTAALCLSRRRLRHAGCILLCAVLGFGLSYKAHHLLLPEERIYQVSGIVIQEAQLREDGQVQTILTQITLDGRSCSANAYWTFYLPVGDPLPAKLLPGAAVSFNARLYHPSGPSNPGGFDFRAYLLQRGVHVGLYGAEELSFPDAGLSLAGASAALRHTLSRQLMEVMGKDSGAYAAALLLGERSFLPDAEVTAFQQLGIAHILSVSGYHVGVLAALLGYLLRPLHLRRSHRVALQSLLLAAYCLLTGAAAPVVRATLLFLLLESGHLVHRKNLMLHLLCLSASIQLLFQPAQLFSASFQLTYGAMLGISLVLPWLRGQFPCRPPLIRLRDGLCAAFAAQLGVLPAQLYWFGELPLLSLLINLPVMALTSGLMTLYWLTLALLPIPVLREFLGTAAHAVTTLLTTAVRFLGSIEGITLWVRRADLLTLTGWLMMMCGMSVLIPRRMGRVRRILIPIGLVLILCLLIPLPHDATEYIQFSVGEADAALLHDQDKVIVIDTGEDAALASYLYQRRLTIDTLILTHLHTDHAGGVQALLDQGIPVRRCCLPTNAEQMNPDPGMPALIDALAAQGTEIVYLSRSDVLPLPSGEIQVLWPAEGMPSTTDANDGSLALLVTVQGTSLLLTGDLTGAYEPFAAFPADVLKAAHHGSEDSTTPEFLAAVSPGIILLSCGQDSRTDSLMQRAGDIPVYATDTSGAIALRFHSGSYSISTCHPTEK